MRSATHHATDSSGAATHRPTHLYLLSSASEAGMESLRTLDMEGSWLGCCGRMCLCVRWREWRVVGERRVSQSL